MRSGSFLEIVEDLDELRYERRQSARSRPRWKGSATRRSSRRSRRGGAAAPKPDKSVKQAEFETLVAAKEEIGEDRPDGDFFARSLPRAVWDRPWMAPIERVVLVHRLREVIAQVGFTRFESAAPDIEGELEIGRPAGRRWRARSLAAGGREPGRGRLPPVQARSDPVHGWREPAVQKRALATGSRIRSWKKEHQGSNREFPGPALPHAALASRTC